MYQHQAVLYMITPDVICVRISKWALENWPAPKRAKHILFYKDFRATSTYVIYLVHCKKCNFQYLGFITSSKLDLRPQIVYIKTNKKTWEVSIHLNRTPHILSDFLTKNMSVFTFPCMDEFQTNTILDTENYVSRKKRTGMHSSVSLASFGLNKRLKFHSKNRIHYI